MQTVLADNDALVSAAVIVATDGIDGGAAEGKSKELVAYFVPTAQANAQAVNDGLAGVADEVDLWESIYDDAYVKKDAVGAAHDENHAIGFKAEQTTQADDYDDALAGLSAEDMITNWSAYISSYSGKLWPRSTIEHWVNATVDRFLDMRPKRMLELGSGNGMLAFRAALRPEVEEVWMADLSGEACRYVEKVRAHPNFAHIQSKCKVLHRPAHDFSGVPENRFDVIVMNAMTMYFPSQEYFTDVLRKCSKSLRPGGYVYMGCCRSLEHLQHFHTDVELFNAKNETTALELRRACILRREKEKELLHSPDFFYRHKKTMPGCFDKCAILLRRGYDCPKVGERGADPRHADAPVEMTRWRYDVFLLKGELPDEEGVTVPAGTPTRAKSGKIPISGSRERLQMLKELNFEGQRTLDSAVETLRATGGCVDAIVVRNVPNARVLDAVACELVIDHTIADGERRGKAATVSDVRRAIAVKTGQLAASNGGVGVCPEAFLEHVEKVGDGKLSAQIMFTPSATADANVAAAGTNAAAHLFDVLIYKLREGEKPSDTPLMPLREARFRVGELQNMVDYGRMQVAPLLSRLAPIELGGMIQRRDQEAIATRSATATSVPGAACSAPSRLRCVGRCRASRCPSVLCPSTCCRCCQRARRTSATCPRPTPPSSLAPPTARRRIARPPRPPRPSLSPSSLRSLPAATRTSRWASTTTLVSWVGIPSRLAAWRPPASVPLASSSRWATSSRSARRARSLPSSTSP